MSTVPSYPTVDPVLEDDIIYIIRSLGDDRDKKATVESVVKGGLAPVLYEAGAPSGMTGANHVPVMIGTALRKTVITDLVDAAVADAVDAGSYSDSHLLLNEANVLKKAPVSWFGAQGLDLAKNTTTPVKFYGVGTGVEDWADATTGGYILLRRTRASMDNADGSYDLSIKVLFDAFAGAGAETSAIEIAIQEAAVGAAWMDELTAIGNTRIQFLAVPSDSLITVKMGFFLLRSAGTIPNRELILTAVGDNFRWMDIMPDSGAGAQLYVNHMFLPRSYPAEIA